MKVVQINSSRISPMPSQGNTAYLSAKSGSPKFINTLVPVTGTISAATTCFSSFFLTASSKTPSYTIPFTASTVMVWPPFMVSVAFLVATIQGICSSRDTIAAWHVVPPELVTIALAFFMAGTQSGAVISVTKMSSCWNFLMSETSKITLAFPATIPGEAGSPLVMTFRSVVISCFAAGAFPAHAVSGLACKIHNLFVLSSNPHSMSMGFL